MSAALLAEFESHDGLVKAIEALRAEGYGAQVPMDAYTPYPAPHVEHALGIPRTPVPKFMALGALFGGGGAYFLQWWLNGYDYPLNVGGRPPHMSSAFLLVTFEMAVLFAAFAAIISVFALSKLPRLWHPVDEIEGFDRATIDRFWLVISGAEPKLDRETTPRRLQELGALRVVPVAQEED